MAGFMPAIHGFHSAKQDVDGRDEPGHDGGWPSIANARIRRLGEAQIEKLVPQPQEAVAWGLLTRNEAPIRSSTKSISEPAR
jgi:hypothetical protein